MVYAIFLISYLIAAGLTFYNKKEYYLANRKWALVSLVTDLCCWMLVAYFVTEMLKMQ